MALSNPVCIAYWLFKEFAENALDRAHEGKLYQDEIWNCLLGKEEYLLKFLTDPALAYESVFVFLADSKHLSRSVKSTLSKLAVDSRFIYETSDKALELVFSDDWDMAVKLINSVKKERRRVVYKAVVIRFLEDMKERCYTEEDVVFKLTHARYFLDLSKAVERQSEYFKWFINFYVGYATDDAFKAVKEEIENIDIIDFRSHLRSVARNLTLLTCSNQWNNIIGCINDKKSGIGFFYDLLHENGVCSKIELCLELFYNIAEEGFFKTVDLTDVSAYFSELFGEKKWKKALTGLKNINFRCFSKEGTKSKTFVSVLEKANFDFLSYSRKYLDESGLLPVLYRNEYRLVCVLRSNMLPFIDILQETGIDLTHDFLSIAERSIFLFPELLGLFVLYSIYFGCDFYKVIKNLAGLEDQEMYNKAFEYLGRSGSKKYYEDFHVLESFADRVRKLGYSSYFVYTIVLSRDFTEYNKEVSEVDYLKDVETAKRNTHEFITNKILK